MKKVTDRSDMPVNESMSVEYVDSSKDERHERRHPKWCEKGERVTE